MKRSAFIKNVTELKELLDKENPPQKTMDGYSGGYGGVNIPVYGGMRSVPSRFGGTVYGGTVYGGYTPKVVRERWFRYLRQQTSKLQPGDERYTAKINLINDAFDQGQITSEIRDDLITTLTNVHDLYAKRPPADKSKAKAKAKAKYRAKHDAKVEPYLQYMPPGPAPIGYGYY